MVEMVLSLLLLLQFKMVVAKLMSLTDLGSYSGRLEVGPRIIANLLISANYQQYKYVMNCSM